MLEKEEQFSLELDENIAEGLFSNLVVINHSDTEFVLDFVNVMPGVAKPKVKSRLILTPQHAKSLAKALLDNIKNYESLNGTIKDSNTNQKIVSSAFGTKGDA